MMQKDNSVKEKYIAFVCSGNTCRSPMAEGIFNSIAKERGINVLAESFGLNTMSGLPATDNSVEACKEIGIDISGHRSTYVGDVELDKYSVFVCMTAEHARVLNLMYSIPYERLMVLDISDPYGGGLEVYKACCAMIYDSVEEMLNEN